MVWNYKTIVATIAIAESPLSGGVGVGYTSSNYSTIALTIAKAAGAGLQPVSYYEVEFVTRLAQRVKLQSV